RLGKSQSTVANRLRLLSLPDDIQDGLLHKKITERHARSLMTLKTTEEQVEYYEKVIEQGLTVRELDDLIKSDYAKPVEKKKSKHVSKDVRIATNTIKRSLKMISDTGIDVESEEEDLDDYYQITIKVKKNK